MAKAKTKAKKKAVVVLPKKMSRLIKIALRDIRKAEEAEFIINMHDWYKPAIKVTCNTFVDGYGETVVREYETCSLCLAGSVMRFSLAGEQQKKRELTPSMFSKNRAQLEAINALRMGDVGEAAEILNLDYNGTPVYNEFDTGIPDYDMQDPEPFHRTMTKLQVKLEKAGL